ncbi:hypothetical protein Tco_0838512 [Tanacetum coccineum]|uniref:Uncharacterized protein n=1 Tax=Tanacetum coccineum TaxID=301880 RepID=A0ABQ5AN05_9ASTR
MNQNPGNSKEVGTPRYLSIVVPLRKISDEAVHKELGDRMERAATTASSSEAEHDSGSGPRCQETILGDVDAQTRFETTSNQSIDPPLSKLNTFGSREDSMKILELMDIVHNYLHWKEAETAHAETEEEEHLNTPSNDPLPSGEDSMQLNELMALCTQLQKHVLDLEKVKSDQVVEIASLKKRNEDRMFDIGVLDDDEVFVDVASSEKNEQSTKIDDSTAGKTVTTASVEDSAAPTIQVSNADIGEVTTAKINEITLAQTLIEIKAAKPKVVTTAATTTTTTRPKGKGVVVQEPSEFRVPQESQPSVTKDKGKGIMVKPEVPLKRKDQISLDEQIARYIQSKLDAELEEE